MYPELPQSFDGLSAAELRELADSIRNARRAQAKEILSAEDHEAWTQWGLTEARVRTLADETQADEDAEAQRVAAEEAAAKEAEEAAAKEAEEAAAKEAEEAAAAASEDDTSDDESDKDDDVDTAASTDTAVTRVADTGMSLDNTGDTGTGNSDPMWLASGESPKADKGQAFADRRELAAYIDEVLHSKGDLNQDKTILATINANPTDAQRISGDRLFVDMARMSDPDEIEAAFCTPLTPLYGLACANITRRPVFNGLPTFVPDANRGGFRVPTSPSIDDITGGFGQWTSTDDADSEAIKAACQTITCVSWNDFEWYATYRCLKVRNMMQMTFPELVDAYLNRLEARWARYSEVLLLEAMANQATSIDGFAQSFGAGVSLQRNLLTYLAKYREIERWDVGQMDAWMPRWLQYALRMDIASRRKDAGGMVPSEEAVDQIFTEVGITPHWYIDRPSWATPLSPLAVSGDLTMFPSTAEILVAPRGKFAVMDKGQLNLGLGGNPIRIENDVRQNQATFFFESYEGLIDTTSCPAHLLTVTGLCYNGFQIADRKIECEGYDLVGEGSGA